MLIGLVGKPSCGKSTLFKAATLADVAIASYPFTTIKPNYGTGYVRVPCVEKEFTVRCNPRFGYCRNGTRFVPVELIDVAGLIPGAHEGKGLGNQFLNDLNQADVLIHIVDVSGTTNEKGEATQGYDPVNDVLFLEKEIDLWYLSILKRGWDKVARSVVQTKEKIEKILAKQLGVFLVSEEMVKDAILTNKLNPEKPTEWTEEQMLALATQLRRRTKPILIAANKVDMPGAKENYERISARFPEYRIIPCSADAELALREAAKKGLIDYVPGDKDFNIAGNLNEKQRAALEKIRAVLHDFGSTGVQNVLDSAVFDFLKYVAIFPGGLAKLADSEGRVLPDCFLMPPGTTAIGFAGRLHTDFAKNFLYAVDVKKRVRIGRDQELKNRDVVEIVSAAR